MERGILTFDNPHKIDPVIDLVAKTEVQGFDITLNLSGTVERLDAPLLVQRQPGGPGDPGAPRDRPAPQRRTGTRFDARRPAGRAATVARQFLYGQAASAISKRVGTLFGLDRFRINPVATETGQSVSGVGITVGKRLSKDVFVTYSTDPTTNRQYIVQVEWQLRKNVTLLLTQVATAPTPSTRSGRGGSEVRAGQRWRGWPRSPALALAAGALLRRPGSAAAGRPRSSRERAAPAETAGPSSPRSRCGATCRSPRADSRSLIDVEVGEPLTDVRSGARCATSRRAASPRRSRSTPATIRYRGGVVAVVVFRAVVQVRECSSTASSGCPATTCDDSRSGWPSRSTRTRWCRASSSSRTLYERNGYLGAGARRRRHRPGAPAGGGHLPGATAARVHLVGTIDFDPRPIPFQPPELVKQLRLKPGDPFAAAAPEDADRLEGWLIQHRRHDPGRRRRARSTRRRTPSS